MLYQVAEVTAIARRGTEQGQKREREKEWEEAGPGGVRRKEAGGWKRGDGDGGVGADCNGGALY